MPKFRVIWYNEGIESISPLTAAKESLHSIQHEGILCFTVINEETGEEFSVDLDEKDEDSVVPVK